SSTFMANALPRFLLPVAAKEIRRGLDPLDIQCASALIGGIPRPLLLVALPAIGQLLNILHPHSLKGEGHGLPGMLLGAAGPANTGDLVIAKNVLQEHQRGASRLTYRQHDSRKDSTLSTGFI